MKQYTSQDKTAKLIELGFEKPRLLYFGNKTIGDYAYTIGELIEMLPTIVNDFTLWIGRDERSDQWFVKNGEYDEWNIGTRETPNLLGVSLGRPAITIKWNGSSIFIDQARYVHQLQHALRLAGVEKEIEI